MFTIIKMLVGFIFSLGMAYLAYSKRDVYGKMSSMGTLIVSLIAAVIFLGQFISILRG